MAKSFNPTILKLQVSLKGLGVFIYYRELCELLRETDSSLRLSNDTELGDYISLEVFFYKRISWDSFCIKIKREYENRVKNLSSKEQIVLSKSLLREILSKHYSKEIKQIVVSEDFEKFYLKLVD